ncbi:uncharacterized protein LOC124253738 isoform X2 [Haliotis rubra]|uniref:uncharacterized protein LOC124253738 isoform X2 n=1 Tax=Haliotis rubra TaxID=36100 RepID=UPI001EE6139C|nr:uncharacterized protein LOC124253738 isoform X2 [Haliotis rubra]
MKVLLLLGLWLVSAQTGTAQVCKFSAASTVGPNDPRLPHALPPSFQVTIEGALIDRNCSVVAEEYFDLDSQRSAMKITQNGQIEYLYINMNTNESYHITNNNCTVKNQALDSDDAFIGGRMSNSKMTHTYSTSSVLKFAQKYGEVYIGQSTIRGVLCDHWQSCMYWSSLGVNFTLDYYFSALSWTSADGTVQVPVRAEVQGYNSLVGPGPMSSFHHIYDYIGFKSYIVDPTNLETQKGVACPGRKHTRAMPQLKQHYQYREEITDQDLNMVVNADVWYDYNYKLLRFDTRPTALAYPYYSYDAVTEIHDYNTGVAYIIDKSFLNCTIVPIENGTWDASMNVSRSHQALGMKSPEQLFDLNPTFAYSGQRTVRGITCDVFTNVRTDFPDSGLMGMPVTFDVYFMSNDWMSDNDVGNNEDSVDTPVRLEISASGYFLSYDFYNFDQENPVLRRFDISKCYTDQNKINFEITFPGNYNDFLLNYQTILEELALVVLAKTAGLSPIRIQRLSSHWDTKNAYLVGTILDKAPDLARYRRWPNLVAHFKDDATVQNIKDAVSCSAVCEKQQVTCNSFDICPGQQTCDLSLNYTSDGTVLQSSDTCDHYSRVLTGTVDHETPLAMAYNLIAAAVTRGTFDVPVALPSVGIKETFTATSIRMLSYSATTPGATQNPNPGQQTPKPNPGQQTPKPNPGQQTSKPIPGQQTPRPGTGNNPTKAPVNCGDVGTPQKSSSSGGTIAGVALAMLAVGVIIGVAVMMFVQRRQKKAENYQVAFVNKNFEN